jgi:hypothetical protein
MKKGREKGGKYERNRENVTETGKSGKEKMGGKRVK